MRRWITQTLILFQVAIYVLAASGLGHHHHVENIIGALDQIAFDSELSFKAAAHPDQHQHTQLASEQSCPCINLRFAENNSQTSIRIRTESNYQAPRSQLNFIADKIRLWKLAPKQSPPSLA